MKVLFDTNILLDLINGISEARYEIRRYDNRAISIVTWIEVLVGAEAGTEATLRAFLDHFSILPVDLIVAQEAALVRKQHRLKLPDAIIWATARTEHRLFVTRDTKDFPVNDPGIRVPYTVG